MKCKKCHSQLNEDKKAIYFHWKYFCVKCNGFIINPEQMEKGE